jgi:pimeloyl-ACP methyl ester carboxylesterase
MRTDTAHEVRVDGTDHVLAGTFTPIPGAVAAALLLPGSGRTDRDSDARLPGGMTLRAGITRAIAAALAGAGVSTLRYDKRGVGASEGDFWRAGLDDMFADARTARAWLAAHAPGLPVLVIGHSEGTYHAARLAADGQADGIVLLAATVRPGEEVLAWQTEQLAATLPRSSRILLRLMRTDLARAQRENLGRVLGSTDDVMRLGGRRVNARWLREFAAYDPAPVLGRVTVPVLAVTGGADLQVPPADVEAAGRLVRGPFEGHVIGDLSHVLRPDPGRTGPRGYRRAVREPVSPTVLDLVTAWISRHWGTPTPDPARDAAAEGTR